MSGEFIYSSDFGQQLKASKSPIKAPIDYFKNLSHIEGPSLRPNQNKFGSRQD